MTAFQRMTFELEARKLISRARKVERQAARNRGELPYRRFCTCGPCLRMWTVRGLAVVVVLHLFGAF